MAGTLVTTEVSVTVIVTTDGDAVHPPSPMLVDRVKLGIVKLLLGVARSLLVVEVETGRMVKISLRVEVTELAATEEDAAELVGRRLVVVVTTAELETC